ncbi:uncharacterized protein LOC131303049 [Rhododendron vialii]|uniref:uncharacterized protein LOC131303049 n=1 Tax=Rhododendron vialii TaxID=182163 RepID=UPI00265E9689|nr:uncharacterized protein LOC131303049 [Rhododendron vialii]
MDMNTPREGASNSRPPFFDGNDYPYWKARMTTHLSSLGVRVWRSIRYGYEAPTIEDTTTKQMRAKEDTEWNSADNESVEANSKALGAIYGALSKTEFSRISACTTAKEAWDILRVTHEGTKTVKTSKLQMLTTRFEDLRMQEDETFDSFITKLSDIINSFHALGEPIPNLKVCRKVLRSLPERFRAKVLAIEESDKVDDILFEELVGKLQTFELNHLSKKPTLKPNKSIAFKSSREESFVTQESDDDLDEEKLAFFAKKFSKFVKFHKNNESENFPSLTSGGKNFNFGDNEKKSSIDKFKKSQGVQCHECHGFGHVQAECANTLKKKVAKGYKATWDDDSDENSDRGFEASRYSVLVANIKSPTSPKSVELSTTLSDDSKYVSTDEDCENSDDDIDSIHEAYNRLFKEGVKLKKKKKELVSVIEKINGERNKLSDDIESKNTELKELKTYTANLKDNFAKIEKEHVNALKALEGSKDRIFELEHDLREATEAIKCNECGATRIAEMTHTFRNRSDLGFVDPPSLIHKANEFTKNEIKFVKSDIAKNEVVSDKPESSIKSPTIIKNAYNSNHASERKNLFICHYCGGQGHIRPFCYTLRRDNQRTKGKLFVAPVNKSVQYGQPNVGRPQVVHQFLTNFKNENFQNKLSQLANQTSHLVEEIKKLSNLAKNNKETDMIVERHTTHGHTSHVNTKPKQTWKRVNATCHVAHTTYRAQDACVWYLDSGCSRHMSRNKSLFAKLEKYNGGLVTFGDGNTGKIVGQGTVNALEIPLIDNVLYVEGLKANLLSIGQFCDNMHEVNFSKNNCSIINASEIWHQRLGHLNFPELHRITKNDIVRGVPKLANGQGLVCDGYMKESHAHVSTHTISLGASKLTLFKWSLLSLSWSFPLFFHGKKGESFYGHGLGCNGE